MSNGPNLYEVKCPNCGAPLQMTSERITCNYCGSVIEQPKPDTSKESAQPKRSSQPQVVVIQSEYSTTSTTQHKSGGCACLTNLLIVLVILGGVAGFAWFRFSDLTDQLLTNFNLAEVSSKLANSVTISQVNRLFLLPSGHDGPPDLVTFVYPISGENPVLAYKTALSSTLRWQSPQPVKEWYAAKVLASPTLIYTNDETKLLALNRTDGKLAWQAPLADKLVSSCINCFVLLGERVIALIQGGTVQAFDAQSGQERWRKRLNFESTSRIETMGEHLLIFDRTQDNRHNLMLVTDPNSGEVVNEVTIPDCQGEGFDLFNPMAFSQSELYFMAGDIIGPACVQVWNSQNWQMTRQVAFEGIALPADFSSFTSEQSKLRLLGEMLYFSGTEKGSDENVIVRVNPAAGQWTAVARSNEYELTALAVTGDTLVVRARRDRGTARDELWGVDPTTAQPRWQYVLQAPRWYKDPGSGAAWDWQLTPHGLAVLQISADPDQLTLDMLDPQTGVSAGQNTIPLSDTYLTDIGWGQDTVWLAVRTIYAIDLKSRSLTSTWP